MEKTNYLITSSGKKKAVVLPIKTYRQLMEDLHDLSVIAERQTIKFLASQRCLQFFQHQF